MIADAEYLKKNNVFDAQSQLVVGQAYYKGQDYAGCVRYTKTLGTGETALELQARCAYEVGDDVDPARRAGAAGGPHRQAGILGGPAQAG